MIAKLNDLPESVQAIIKAHSRKRSAILMVRDRTSLQDHQGWQGGSRTSSLLVLASRPSQVRPIPAECRGTSWPSFTAGEDLTLHPGEVLVEVGTFRGKPATPTLIASETTWASLGLDPQEVKRS